MRLLIAALFLCVTAQAKPFVPMVPMDRRASPSLVASDSNVSYFGGPVIGSVKVYVVYWGQGVDADTQKQLGSFYTALLNSSYLDVLSEYATKRKAVDGRDGTNQEIGRGKLAGTFTIDPVNTSKSLKQADVENELEAQISRGSLPKPDGDSYYAIHFPDGYSLSISFGLGCSSWLADHEVYKSKKFGNVYYAMFPCDSGDFFNFDTLTVSASHELAEAISDPTSPLQGEASAYPAGWLRSDGQEIGDLCMNTSATLMAGGTRYSVNALWLNSESGCHGGEFKGQ